MFGESAGGNLATALSIQLNRMGIQPGMYHICCCVPPCTARRRRRRACSLHGGGRLAADRLVLAYPALNLNSTPSPSRFFHLSDPLVPTAALLPGCARAYVPLHLRDKAVRDPLMCPLFAGDEELCHLPPTFLSTGGCDPLLDDVVEFDARLRRLRIPGELQVHRSLPHGFFMLKPFLADASTAIDGILEWIRTTPSHEPVA